MLHSHATPQRSYITADKLHLNKLPHANTHASGIKLLPLSKVEVRVVLASMPKLLQMLLAD
jgi:hypothetical protein